MKHVNQLLGYQNLAKLVAKVQSLTKLNDTLQAILPPALRGHVSCAKLERGKLTLIASSGSYSTQIRFSSQAIMMGLNEALPDQSIDNVHCIVRPAAVKEKKRQKKPRLISATAAEQIMATAATISDEKLRLIWQRLGQSYPG